MLKHPLLILLALLALAPAALATIFVVPEDEELIAKSQAIVIGTVEGKWVDTSRGVDTVYEIRVERAIKGVARAQQLLRIVSPGGELEDGGVFVPGAAHFELGERNLLFLTEDNGRWSTTDLTLGKFKFETSTAGARVLVRDAENIVGWDRSGATHVERVRREAGFLRFIEERVAGRRPAPDYFVAPRAITLSTTAQEDSMVLQPHAPAFPAKTYTDNILYNGNYVGTRWSNMSAGVTIYKRSETNIPGAGDGGVSVIQNAIASWNNEPASSINLIYGGNRANTPSANHDGISIVEFNDPQGRISGSWGGSGTLAVTFISYFNPHEFPVGSQQLWWSIRDADPVFQDGYTASSSAFPTGMTHELGHGVGFRHSNAHYIRTSGGVDQACNASVEECSSSAIMYYLAISSLGCTLQTWDQNAAQAVYPGGGGGPICTPPTITTHPQSRTVATGTLVTLTVAASGTTPFGYQWYIGTSGNTASPIAGATGPTLNITANNTASYWVRVSNSCGSANSNTATITVTPPSGSLRQRAPTDFNGNLISELTIYRRGTWHRWDPNSGGLIASVTTDNFGDGIPLPMDYDGDGRAEFSVYRPGLAWHFYNDNGTYLKGIWIGVAGDIPAPADYDGDGREDVVVYRTNGTWVAYDFNTGAVKWVVNTGIIPGGIPLPMDYDGDLRADFTVYRPGAAWHIYNDDGSYRKGIWIGVAGDIPVPGDYDGNGIEDLVLFRGGSWVFYDINNGALYRSTATAATSTNGDPLQPAPLDLDGDGSVEFTILGGGRWNTYHDNGALRGAVNTGGVPGDLALSRRDLWKNTP